MKRFVIVSIMAAICSLSMYSCTKVDPPGTTDPGTTDPGTTSGFGKVKLEFANKAGAGKLSLNDQWYINANGDSFQVTKFNYYISNIKLNGSTGGYTEPESYHLLQQDLLSSMSFDLTNVPYGKYSGVTLMIGVDSLRNVSGAQTGALDPMNDMFWTWNTGYIMLKFEATSPQSSNAGLVTYHAGGYSGQYATQRTVTLNFPTEITVGKDGENHVHLEADILKLFTPNKFSFSSTPSIMTDGKNGRNLANNYANMLTVTYSGL